MSLTSEVQPYPVTTNKKSQRVNDPLTFSFSLFFLYSGDRDLFWFRSVVPGLFLIRRGIGVPVFPDNLIFIDERRFILSSFSGDPDTLLCKGRHRRLLQRPSGRAGKLPEGKTRRRKQNGTTRRLQDRQHLQDSGSVP